MKINQPDLKQFSKQPVLIQLSHENIPLCTGLLIGNSRVEPLSQPRGQREVAKPSDNL